MQCGNAMRCDDRFRQSSRSEPSDRFAVRNYTSSHAARVDARSAPPLKVPQDCPPKPRVPCRATPVIEVACVGAAERAALRAVLVSVVRIASASTRRVCAYDHAGRQPWVLEHKGYSGLLLGGIACAELDDEQLLYAGALIALDACAASTPSAPAPTGCAG